MTKSDWMTGFVLVLAVLLLGTTIWFYDSFDSGYGTVAVVEEFYKYDEEGNLTITWGLGLQDEMGIIYFYEIDEEESDFYEYGDVCDLIVKDTRVVYSTCTGGNDGN